MPKLPLQITFDYERDTKSKVRFRERGTSAVGVLYLNQHEYGLLGQPKVVSVRIEASP